MEQQPLPEWIKTAFDMRFIEQANIIGKMPEIEPLHLRQVELKNRLKEELSSQLSTHPRMGRNFKLSPYI